jgi:hypothetical protein
MKGCHEGRTLRTGTSSYTRFSEKSYPKKDLDKTYADNGGGITYATAPSFAKVRCYLPLTQIARQQAVKHGAQPVDYGQLHRSSR